MNYRCQDYDPALCPLKFTRDDGAIQELLLPILQTQFHSQPCFVQFERKPLLILNRSVKQLQRLERGGLDFEHAQGINMKRPRGLFV